MVNSRVISQINKVTECGDELSHSDIPSLIDQLSDPDDPVRVQAREILTCLGKPAVPELVKALSAANSQLRWQIIKVLECIQEPSSIPVLVEQLKDENAGIRWAAANALIQLKRDAVPSLLEALIHDIDSVWLRTTVHHILHVFKDDGLLTASEEKVYQSLEDIEPTSAVPWAAQHALEALRHKKR